jgi:hypothetical protein
LVLLGVITSTIALFEVSTNHVVEVWVEIELWCFVRGKTSCTDSSAMDFSQSAFTWNGHKLPALSEMCTTRCRRECDCQNHELIVHCTD